LAQVRLAQACISLLENGCKECVGRVLQWLPTASVADFVLPEPDIVEMVAASLRWSVLQKRDGFSVSHSSTEDSKKLPTESGEAEDADHDARKYL
jgi:hypothetical protein